MVRKAVSPQVQANVLLKSRRRCCICYGLRRDTAIKQGQIAHIDHNSSNNSEENLAFLCFDHHDQYDSKTRQSKNFTQIEVSTLRDELVKHITIAFSGLVSFAEADIDIISGHYIRDGEFESAEIKIKRLSNGKYHIDGLALWGETREYGPNLGTLDFIAELYDNTIEYSWGENRDSYNAVFIFHNGTLKINEENWVGMFGMNVSFQGQYHKATEQY